MRHINAAALALVFFLLPAAAQTPELSRTVKPFVRVDAARVVLTHVRVVDGTGAPAVDDQNLVIEAGKIVAVGKGADVAADPGTAVLDLHGYTVIPGIVGMHDHLF
jgi:imidazolonepropionase-like amidohydrolase